MQILRIFFYFFCFSLLSCCQKADRKQGPRCIYDHRVFAEVAAQAVNDEGHFLQFKRNPFFNLLWENLTFQEGKIWLQKIAEFSPDLQRHFDKFRAVDLVGSPRVFFYGEAGVFSPSTLRLIAFTGELKQKLGQCENGHLLMIGAGQGSWCKILNDAVGFKSCTIVDLPEQLELAKKCLGEWKTKNVKFVTPEELSKGVVYDIVISDMSFSEFNRPYQELLLDRAIACSNSGFIIGHEFPKHFGVVSLTFDQLEERFDRLGNLCCEMQKPSEDREDYFIYWNFN